MTDREAAAARIESVSKGCLERGDCLLQLARGTLRDLGLLYGKAELQGAPPARRSNPGLRLVLRPNSQR